MVELRSKSIDLDLIYEVAKKNPVNAIEMLVLYLKLQQKQLELINKKLERCWTVPESEFGV